MEINGVVFEALLIPYTAYIPDELAEFIEKNSDFPAYFVGGYPDEVLRGADRKLPENDNWKKASKTVKLKELASMLEKQGRKKITLNPAFSQISVYHYKKDRQIFMLMNESPSETFTGKVTLPVSDSLVVYDGIQEGYLDVAGEVKNGHSTVMLELQPGQSCLLMEKKEIASAGVWKSFTAQREECTNMMDLTDGWDVEFIRPKEYPAAFRKVKMKKLVPVSDLEPQFSGIIRYTKEFKLDQIPEKAYFFAENVYEVMKLYINGEEVGKCLTPPYQMEVDHLQEGKNIMVVEAANTPGRDQLNYPMPPFDFSHEPLEPSGMFGKVELYYK